VEHALTSAGKCAQMKTSPEALTTMIENSALQSRARRFRMKAAECYQLADLAKYAQTRKIYIDLAFNYDRLAADSENIERLSRPAKGTQG
jgi:hypothetical protein